MRAKLLQSCWTLCNPTDYSLPGSSVHGDSPGKNTGVGCHAHLHGDPPYPGMEPASLTSLYWQESSFSLAPRGKPFPGAQKELNSCLLQQGIVWHLNGEDGVHLWAMRRCLGSCPGLGYWYQVAETRKAYANISRVVSSCALLPPSRPSPFLM